MRLFQKILCILTACLLTSIPAGAESKGGGDSCDPEMGIRYVALTFDDGPTAGITRPLLDGLRQRYVSATFFLCGYRVEQNPKIARQIAEDGHEVGLHGYTHSFLNTMNRQQVRQELEQGTEIIAQATGQTPQLFRPPGGLTSPAVQEEAMRLSLPIILWSLDPLDWNTHNSAAVASKVIKSVHDGDIILMHDLSQSSVKAAFTIIDTLQDQGYRFCTVSELAQLRGIPLEYAKKYGSFRP